MSRRSLSASHGVARSSTSSSQPPVSSPVMQQVPQVELDASQMNDLGQSWSVSHRLGASARPRFRGALPSTTSATTLDAWGPMRISNYSSGSHPKPRLRVEQPEGTARRQVHGRPRQKWSSNPVTMTDRRSAQWRKGLPPVRRAV